MESFPLFGYDLDDYDELYGEKLELLLRIRDQARVTWSGRHRAAGQRRGLAPDVLRSMELFGTEVAPLVRAEVARREADTGAATEVIQLAE